MLKIAWVAAYAAHQVEMAQREEQAQQEQQRLQRELEERKTARGRALQRQRRLHGRQSSFYVGDLVYYHWVVDVNPRVTTDNKYYMSRIEHVSFVTVDVQL